jgi:hypothetical protein
LSPGPMLRRGYPLPCAGSPKEKGQLSQPSFSNRRTKIKSAKSLALAGPIFVWLCTAPERIFADCVARLRKNAGPLKQGPGAEERYAGRLLAHRISAGRRLLFLEKFKKAKHCV